MQAAGKLVGEDGYVLGIDLKKIDALGLTNVSSVIGDVEKLEGVDVLKLLPRKADVVLSDLSPNVSGVWELDHAKQIYLSELALKLTVAILRPEGNFYAKVFHGISLKEFIDKVKVHFKVVRILKPQASRKGSAEVYIVALGFISRAD